MEPIYRLDLTEREWSEMITTIAWQIEWAFPVGETEIILRALLAKLRALEPIGTGGTTTTEGA